MNAGSADTRSPHLDLGDLIAEVTGQAIADRAREHLARCEQCRAEANRWNLVAGAVRSLAAATPQAARPARRQRTRPHVLAGHRRRTVLATSAAAALVLLGVTAYGTVTALTRHAPGTVLTAVSGCTTLKQADGILEQVNGSSLLVRTAGGRQATVTTTASTLVVMSGPFLSDITDGATVVVHGPRSGQTVAAVMVTVYPTSNGNRARPVNPPPGFVTVRGTVTDSTTAGFTVVTSSGSRVPVTTSSVTMVSVPHASLGQLQAGATVYAVGQAGPDGALSARAVAAVSQPPPAANGNVKANVRVKVKVRDCSPTSIAEAIGAIGAGPVSGG